MTHPGIIPDDVRNAFKTMWWVVLLRGLLMVAFGVFMVTWPEPALVAFVWLFGIYAIADGVASLAHVWRSKSKVGMGAGLGVVSILAGLIALLWPQATAIVVLLIVAVWILLLGVIQMAAGVTVRSIPGSGWGWMVASGVMAIVLGFILFAVPEGGILAFLTFVGVMTIMSGGFLIISAIFVRNLARNHT